MQIIYCKKLKYFNNWKIIVILVLCALLALVSVILAAETTNNSNNFNNNNNNSNNKALIKETIIINLPGLGKLEGLITNTAWSERNIYQFFGIPFAESPTGNLRFKPPIRRSKWSGILDATKHGRRCPVKGLHFPFTLNNSHDSNNDIEDCLTINVYTTDFITKKPVMIYIHGGGFYNGTSSIFKSINLLEKDIVLVIPQYRLGILGFLSTNSPDIPGNMALHDIKLALEWTQKYIINFGGDKNSITIFGQSAGAALISALMISPIISLGTVGAAATITTKTNKLFHKVILQSGTIMSDWAVKPYTIDSAKYVCQKAECINCNDINEINHCLKNLNIFKLLEISTDNLLIKESYTPIIGDYYNILPKGPRELIKNSTKYPMIVGVTKHDGSFILASVYDRLKAKIGNFKEMDPRLFIRELIEEKDISGTIENMAIKFLFKKTYLTKRNYKRMIPGFIDLAGMVALKSPTLLMAMLNNENNPYPTYLYSFDYKGEHTYYGYGENTSHYPFDGGVHHSNDYIYLLATYPLNNDDNEFAKNIIELWTSFALTGQPKRDNDVDQVKWIPLNGTGPYLHIDKINTIGDDFQDEFWITSNDERDNLIRENIEF